MFYIIIKNKDLQPKFEEAIEFDNGQAVRIVDDNGIEKDYYVLKLKKEHHNLFTNYKKFSAEAVRLIIQKIKNDTIKDTEIMYSVDQVDYSGRPVVFVSASPNDWRIQFHSIDITTSTGAVHLLEDGSASGLVTTTLYDNSNNVTVIPANAVKTVVDFSPDFDYEALGAHFNQTAPPISDIRLFVTAAPSLADINYIAGGFNIKNVWSNNITLKANSPAFMQYIQGTLTNTLRFTILHNAGMKHQFQITLELFKDF